MPEVYRVSLVRMYYSTVDTRSQTPTPFCELRSFLFLNSIPTTIQKRRLRSMLAEELNKLEDIIESVGEQKRAGTIAEYRDPKRSPYLEILKPTPIEVKMPTRNVKVMIEGYEVEQVDLDEVFEMRGSRYFSTPTQDRVMISRGKFLNLLLGKPQRYFALFDAGGDIRFEYDEADIKGRLVPLQIQRRRIVNARTNLINSLIDWRKRGDFQQSIYDIMRIVERQQKLRK